MTDKHWPEWATPGSEVGVYSLTGSGMGAATAERLTVERVLKRDVVLSNGDRFTLPSMSADGSSFSRTVGGTWGRTYWMTRPDAPEFLRAERRVALSRARRSARLRCEDMLTAIQGSDVAAILEAQRALRVAVERLVVLMGGTP